MTDVGDRWNAAATYEEFMGRWSRQLAARFVSWLKVPAGAHWLDVGCGTGALTAAICAGGAPASVTGCDPAAPFVEFARAHTADARASFVAAGVGTLPRRAGGYDSVTSLLALNFFPDAGAALHEMLALAAPRAVVSACVWDYADGMQWLRRFWDAAVSVDVAAKALDEGERFPLCRADALTALFSGAGLAAVRCEPLEIATVFTSFDDYWRPFLGGTGPAPSYVASLDPERRARLQTTLADALTPQRDGTIGLIARAWAVRGTVTG
jgi:SAM-dependent methyltransferase